MGMLDGMQDRPPEYGATPRPAIPTLYSVAVAEEDGQGRA